MILGTGVDIIELSRIERLLNNKNEAFLDRIYTKEEQLEGIKKGAKISYYAGRWAAKEAVAKALGTGFGEHCNWVDVEILNDPSGKPVAKLLGKGAIYFEKIAGKSIFISISHDNNSAIAMAIIEN